MLKVLLLCAAVAFAVQRLPSPGEIVHFAVEATGNDDFDMAGAFRVENVYAIQCHMKHADGRLI